MGVYLDHAATTPMLPEAIDAYARAMSEVGNPSSIHSAGQNARRLLEESREAVAESLGCDPIEVVFTSGGTEAINLALKGGFWAARAASDERRRIVSPEGEHHATIDTIEWLVAHEGAQASWVPLDEQGFIQTDAWAEALRGDDVAVATALWANNEVGTIEPVAALASAAASASVPLHLDAVAAYGHVPISFRELGIASLSVSAHKIGGPVGIGALVLSRRASVVPTVHGGGQQRNVRSGTQDVAAAVSFAVAARAAVASLDAERERLTALRDRLIAGVRAAVPAARLSGPEGDARVASNAHFTFPGAQGDSLLFLLDAAGVAVSTGSACQAGIPEPSHVVLAMGRATAEASSALRITLGRTTTQADVDAFLAALPDAYARAAKAGFTTSG
ncbi:cysteine desulfurase family protein [Gryllotalpicola daejeonensis]|uniref:Cysteine desulfurase family protein n=1 Tax=Gryllotalpicola daejeonensis TaxID=993087 RepID=A0ABP7ZG65_9MICO